MAKRRRREKEAERITIIVVIVIAMLIVAAATAIRLFDTPERNVKSKMDSVVSDYYENYFYEKLAKASATNKSFDQAMEKYREPGFARIDFNQLFLYDNKKHNDIAPLITKYCDAEKSFVIIYPDPPYGKTDYHTQFYYSCEF